MNNTEMLRTLKEANMYMILRKYPYMKNFFIFLFTEYGNNALLQYINNVFLYFKNHADDRFTSFCQRKIEESMFVDMGFCWADTKEGHEFWKMIHYKWYHQREYKKYYSI